MLEGTYEVVRRVGSGGMGEVYEARHTRLPGRLAVKLLRQDVSSNPEAFARFRREAEITSALRHPNIVQVVDFNVTADGAPYIVMEYLDGVDLSSRLVSRQPMPLPEVVAIIKQVASGLAAAHARDVVHRDLKPQNIFLVRVEGQDGEFAKIVDFGISKVKTATQKLTRDSTVMGTPQYMSPEQALGLVDEIDARTDEFALGSITYEMLTGQDAFTGDSLLGVMYQVVHAHPRPLAEFTPWASPKLEAVLRRGLAKKKEERFPSVLDFARALEQVAHDAQPTPAPVRLSQDMGRDPTLVTPLSNPAPPPAKPTTFRTTAGELGIVAPTASRRWGLALGGALGVAVAGAVMWVIVHRPPEASPAAAVGSPELKPATAVPPASPAPQPKPMTAPRVEPRPPPPIASPVPTVPPPPARPAVTRRERRERPTPPRPPEATSSPRAAASPSPTPPEKKRASEGLIRSDDL